MNNKSLDTLRNYVEFNAKENPRLNFITCPHTNKSISNAKSLVRKFPATYFRADS